MLFDFQTSYFQMVEQLFTSLDEDCDGMIGLEDFLELFVGQNGCGNGTNDLFGQSSKTQQRINERISLSPSVEVSALNVCCHKQMNGLNIHLISFQHKLLSY